MTAEPEAVFTVEAFDPARHDRAAFGSGVAAVDNYLKGTANKLAKAGNVRLWVMTDEDQRLAGFYALNAHAVQYTDRPPRYARTRPGHGSIPAAFIAMMGRDARFAGQGVGALLLADALMRIERAASTLGIAVVLLDVLECGDPIRTQSRRSFYEGFGFASLPSRPERMMLPVKTISDAITRSA